ncbi:hypothetical protein [Gaoshiqia sp. Z1-71]|uniref:hypothetical protein n=1 Tax=Gaoshiqia hydrogeniformans TaxID=3290090 RepID=UPI003BF7C792
MKVKVKIQIFIRKDVPMANGLLPVYPGIYYGAQVAEMSTGKGLERTNGSLFDWTKTSNR